MIENSKTVITLEEGEELVVGDIVLGAGDTFEIIEAKKDDKKSDDSDMEDDDSEENEKDEKKKKESTIYTVEEDVKVGDVILEKGDKFEIVEAEKSDSSKKDKEASKGKDAKDDEKDSGKKAKDDEKKKESIFTVEEDTPIPGTDIVLEKGDKFKVL